MSNVVVLKPRRPSRAPKHHPRPPESSSAVIADAYWIEAQFGRNIYSDFLRRHGRRPDPPEAKTIGQLIGCRVKASDGRFYPPLTKAQREENARRRAERKAATWRFEEAFRAGHAIHYLSGLTLSPELIVDSMTPAAREEAASQVRAAIAQLAALAVALDPRRVGQGT
jgi:hypothetical protein